MVRMCKIILVPSIIFMAAFIFCSRPNDPGVEKFIVYYELQLEEFQKARGKASSAEEQRLILKPIEKKAKSMEAEWKEKQSRRASDDQKKRFESIQARFSAEFIKSLF